MVRANRYFLPGYAWHLTPRCHKKEFLTGIVEGIKGKLGAKGKYRVVLQKYESWEIQEETNTIRGYSDPKVIYIGLTLFSILSKFKT